MLITDIEVEIDMRCGSCNCDLSASYDGAAMFLEVEPCETCIEAAKEGGEKEGYNDGYKQGHEEGLEEGAES